jgi:hypothetical protein
MEIILIIDELIKYGIFIEFDIVYFMLLIILIKIIIFINNILDCNYCIMNPYLYNLLYLKLLVVKLENLIKFL